MSGHLLRTETGINSPLLIEFMRSVDAAAPVKLPLPALIEWLTTAGTTRYEREAFRQVIDHLNATEQAQ